MIDFLRDGLVDSRALNLVTSIDQPPVQRRMAMDADRYRVPALNRLGQSLKEYNGHPLPPLALFAASGPATSA